MATVKTYTAAGAAGADIAVMGSYFFGKPAAERSELVRNAKNISK